MDEYMGTVTLFAGTFAPRNWAFCDGKLIPINQNQALFSILGTQFGGDGIKNFALPDLRKTAPLPNLNYIICVEGIYPTRD